MTYSLRGDRCGLRLLADILSADTALHVFIVPLLRILVVLIVGSIKRHINKKKIEQEDKEHQEVQDNEKDKQ